MSGRALQVLTVLAVADLAQSTAFYASCFGWTLTVDEALYAEFLQPGGLRFGLYAQVGFASNIGNILPTMAPARGVTPVEIYLYVDDIQSQVTRALDAGGRLLAKRASRPWGDDAAYVADPDGHVLVLAQTTAPSA